MSEFDYTYLSCGAGVQSSTLLGMSARGLRGCPRADAAFFADTQDEPAWVYKNLKVLQAFGAEHGIPVKIVTAGRLSQHIVDRQAGKRHRFANIPAWTRGADGKAAPLRRQCTREYKIDPIEKAVRVTLGYQPRQRVKHRVRCLIGISLDEAQRMKPSRTKWVETAWPLVDARMDRQACKELLTELGLPVPQKSSCVYCPFHSFRFWQELKHHHPAEWAQACIVDKAIRNMSRSGVRSPVYLTRALKPLEELNLDWSQRELFGDGFGNECEGHCGV